MGVKFLTVLFSAVFYLTASAQRSDTGLVVDPTGLKDMKADLNNDGAIYLSEIQQWLRDEVARLSGGKQQPAARAENLSLDFRIW
jgi:hypothetical protein